MMYFKEYTEVINMIYGHFSKNKQTHFKAVFLNLCETAAE